MAPQGARERESGLIAAGLRRAGVNRTDVMVKGIAVRVVTFCVVAACGALGQSERPANGAHPLAQRSAKAAFAQRQKAVRKALPDAPSAVLANQDNQTWKIALTDANLFTQASIGFVPGTGVATVAPGPPSTLIDMEKAAQPQKDSSAFFNKYLYPALSKENLRYQPSSQDGFMGRATDAASRLIVVRDETGRRKLNTSYFLGVLTSVAVRTASRPYWARSGSAPFSDFGATFGNDAGMNLLHEFGPGLRQAVSGHMPEFVNKVQERVVGERNSRTVAPRPGK